MARREYSEKSVGTRSSLKATMASSFASGGPERPRPDYRRNRSCEKDRFRGRAGAPPRDVLRAAETSKRASAANKSLELRRDFCILRGINAPARGGFDARGGLSCRKSWNLQTRIF